MEENIKRVENIGEVSVVRISYIQIQKIPVFPDTKISNE